MDIKSNKMTVYNIIDIRNLILQYKNEMENFKNHSLKFEGTKKKIEDMEYFVRYLSDFIWIKSWYINLHYYTKKQRRYNTNISICRHKWIMICINCGNIIHYGRKGGIYNIDNIINNCICTPRQIF